MTNLRRELVEGENLLLTCIVTNLGEHTVIWSKIMDGKKKLLTIDKHTVAPDTRISVLHDEGMYLV